MNHETNTPRAFGKLKDPKDPITIRPIINKREGATYPIEIYMKDIYKGLLPETNKSLQSTEDFIQKIREAKIEGQIIVSFDIESLFPSVNTKEINSIINEKIKNNYKEKKKQKH